LQRYLPSFPTRRSSDLGYPSSFQENEFIAVPSEQWTSDNWVGSNSDHIVFVKLAKGASIETIVDVASRKRQEVAGEAMKEYGFEDRKSTRLNSSHVKIS